jgi:hypothetical protein
MLSYDKQLRGLSQRLRRNMMELLMIYKSPLTPLFQRGEEKDPHDYAKTPKRIKGVLCYNKLILKGRGFMPVAAKQTANRITVKEFITDTKGRKMAAVIDMAEFKRLESLLDLIPSSEVWLYKNKKAFESVQRGLKQAAKGKITKLNPAAL